jgi:hypothetical protein
MNASPKRANPIRKGLISMTLIGLIGCHSGQLPNAPDLSADTPNIQMVPRGHTPSLRLAFQPLALRKHAGSASSSKIITRWIGEKGGRISITHAKTRANFKVP